MKLLLAQASRRHPKHNARGALETVVLYDGQAPLQGSHEPRQPALFNRSADVTARSDRECADRVDAQPVRRFKRDENSDRASQIRPGGGKRQQQKFKLDRVCVGHLCGDAGDGADLLVLNDRQKVRHDGPTCCGPQFDKALAFELTAEQGADARPGRTEGMSRSAVESEDEYIAEQVANGPRRDVGSFRSGVAAALLLPIGIEVLLTACFMIASRRLRLPLWPMRSPVPDWHKRK